MWFLALTMNVATSIICSRVGQIAMALLVGWTIGWWRTDASWRAELARQDAVREAAYKIEIERQRAATAEIAAEATQRLEYETTRANDMAARIRELQKTEGPDEPDTKLECKDKAGKPVVVRPCRLDGADVLLMRELDTTNRPSKSPSPTGNIRTRSR